jgi:predicted dehydrogenase
MDELNEILSEVKNSGVNILEGIMIDHHPWIRYLEEIVKSNKYGKLNKTKTHISYQLFKDDSYRFKKECGGSVFWDESFLWSHLLQHVGVIELDKIEAQIKFNEPNGIDVEFQSNIQMVNGLKSEALFSYQRPFEFTHWLYFDKMEIKLRNFIRPLFGNVPVIIHISNQSGFTKEVKIEYEDCFKNQLEFFCEMLQGKKNNRPISEITERIEFQDRIYSKAMEMHNGKLQNKNIE